MRILMCNPGNTQGTKHSRKGMYVPLGILSIAAYLKEHVDFNLHIDVADEDVDVINTDVFKSYNIIGLYSTSFNYGNAAKYAQIAKQSGCVTVLGGPHPSVLAINIMRNKECFDYIIRFEAELPFALLVQKLAFPKTGDILIEKIPNLVYRKDGDVVENSAKYISELAHLPIPDRSLLSHRKYIENYHATYPEKKDVRPSSIYSSKGCSWRDKTGGCVFCARLETGVRFRNIDHIWREIQLLRERYDVNSIWDIADDNLNNEEWFTEFVNSKPDSCSDLSFFLYSRVSAIKPRIIELFKKLNANEVFLGIESGDDGLLRSSFKGQTRKLALHSMSLLSENGIKIYPSFVLGLPGETRSSLENTLSMCEEIASFNSLERMSATILKPMPGSPSYKMMIDQTPSGDLLNSADEIDLAALENDWIKYFTNVDREEIDEYKLRIDNLMSRVHVFGSSVKKI